MVGVVPELALPGDVVAQPGAQVLGGLLGGQGVVPVRALGGRGRLGVAAVLGGEGGQALLERRLLRGRGGPAGGLGGRWVGDGPTGLLLGPQGAY